MTSKYDVFVSHASEDKARFVDSLVATLRTNRDVGIVTAAHLFSDTRDALSPHQVKVVIDRAGNALYFSRAPIPASKKAEGRRSLFLRHQGIYGFRRATLLQFVQWKPTPLERCESLEQLRALENGVRVHVLVTKHGSPGVDTPADAEAVAASLRGLTYRAVAAPLGWGPGNSTQRHDYNRRRK